MLQDPGITDPNSYEGKLFRRRFRVPYSVYMTLLARTQVERSFCDKSVGDGKRGPPRHPVCLKVLACLYIIAHGVTFFTLSDMTFMSEKVLRTFYYTWMAWLRATLVP
eukprot:3069148-Pleurochrysis_carterae.AAC.1